MILETKEEIHQWLKKQCPVYVQIVNDDLDGLADYVLKRTIGKGGSFADLTHLSHGRMMTETSEPFHGIMNTKYCRIRVDRSEYVIYFRNQENKEEKNIFAENDGKEDFDEDVAFYSTPTTLDTSFFDANMDKESAYKIKQDLKGHIFIFSYSFSKKMKRKEKGDKRLRRQRPKRFPSKG